MTGVVVPSSVDEIDAEMCRRSLRRYVDEAWPLIEPGRTLVGNWHIDVLCEHLQAVTEGEIRRLIINIPPRGMKSLLTCVFWPTWEWLRDPSRRWLFASYAQQLSTRDAVKSRRLMQSRGRRLTSRDDPSQLSLLERIGYQGLLDTLSQLSGKEAWNLGPWQFSGDQNLKMRYENDRTGHRISTSWHGQATGDGGDRRVIDDPHKPDEVASDVVRQSDLDWYDQVWSSRGMDPKKDTEVVIMQRLHEEDLTGHLLEHGGWEHICLPARYEPKHPFVYPSRVTLPSGREFDGDPRFGEGDLLWSERMDDAFLKVRHTELGSYGFAGQYQQRPSPEDGGILKRGWWRYYEPYQWPKLPDGTPHLQEVCGSVDAAFKDTDGSDYVVLQIWGRDLANKYLLAQVRAKIEFTATVHALLAMDAWAKQHLGQTNFRWYIEDKANGSAIISSLKRRRPGMIPVEPEGGKEARARAAAPQVESGNVWLPRGSIPCASVPVDPETDAPFVDSQDRLLWEPVRTDVFVDEAANFPNSTNDDQVDAFSQALIEMDRRVGKRKVRAGGVKKDRMRDR